MTLLIALCVLLLAIPLRCAPPYFPNSDFEVSNPPNSPAGSRPRQIKCFTRGVQPPISSDCYQAMAEIACGNRTIDDGPVQYTSLPGVHNTVLLPLRWARPACIVIVDLTSSASLPSGVHLGDSFEVETASLLEIASAAQLITEYCVTGGSRLGGKSNVGENGLLSVYVANHPKKEPPPIAVVPSGNTEYPRITDLSMDASGVCASH